jgi:aryl-alcohol dehydrogenase-like predicted oxidoreductase
MEKPMISRREWLGTSLGAGAAVALSPELLRALDALRQPGATLIQKAIPSTGEKIPAVGLSFSNHVSCADHAALREVFKTFVDKGGKLYDAQHGNLTAENFHITIAKELGVEKKLFWSLRATTPGGSGPPPRGPEFVRTQVKSLLDRTGVSKIDLAMSNHTFDATHAATLNEERKAGRIRYIGVQTIVDQGYDAIEAAMRNDPIDFIGVDYDIGNRAIVEDKLFPLAMEKKIGVIAFFPFGNNSGVSCGSGRNLFARVGTNPVPEWAAEFDAKTWAQFFLKYVISHPAVTCARVGTTKATHMADNMLGGVGRLPNEATRKRMAALIDSFPAIPPLPPNPAMAPGIALPAAILDRYVGEYKSASGTLFVIRRNGDRLFVQPGNNPEAPLNARTETRFQDPRGPFFEFQVDAQGKVTGAILEQQSPQGPTKIQLERK